MIFSKRNHAAAIYCLLIIGTVFCSSISRPHAFVKEGHWQATLTIAGQKVPFNLEVRGTSAENAKVFLLSGGERTELAHFQQRQDTLLLALEPYHVLIKARIEKKSLAGEAIPLQGRAAPEEISFRAEHGRRHPEENTVLAGMEGKAMFTGLTSLH
jgi:hypothetical protein